MTRDTHLHICPVCGETFRRVPVPSPSVIDLWCSRCLAAEISAQAARHKLKRRAERLRAEAEARVAQNNRLIFTARTVASYIIFGALTAGLIYGTFFG